MASEENALPVGHCFRCGKPAELAAPRSGWIGSEPESQLPLCPDCFDVLTSDPDAFWAPLRAKRKEP